MNVPAHIAALRREGLLLAAAAATAGPDAGVPSCPGWVVRDLLRHQGGVHRWAAGVVAGPRTEPWRVELEEVVGSWPDDADLLDWFADGHSALVDALERADPDLACWTFLAAPTPLAMWSRRQAHETAIHRVDAELAAAAAPTPFAPAFAADGVDELLSCFITRRGGRLRADPARRLRVSCADTPGDWTVQITADGVTTTAGPGPAVSDPASCNVAGAAADLYLALWNRAGTDSLTVSGEAEVLGLFRDKVQVRWS